MLCVRSAHLPQCTCNKHTVLKTHTRTQTLCIQTLLSRGESHPTQSYSSLGVSIRGIMASDHIFGSMHCSVSFHAWECWLQPNSSSVVPRCRSHPQRAVEELSALQKTPLQSLHYQGYRTEPSDTTQTTLRAGTVLNTNILYETITISSMPSLSLPFLLPSKRNKAENDKKNRQKRD